MGGQKKIMYGVTDFPQIMNRRDFITSAAAATVFGRPIAGCCGGNGAASAAKGPTLRLGLVSDIHWVTHRSDKGLQNCNCFEPALRYFDERKADAIVIAGDLSDIGTEDAVRELASVWDRVFPNGRRSDGEPIVQLMIYGDHDMGGYMHKYKWASKSCKIPGEFGRIIPNGDPARLWEECFHEKWAPIQVKTVKGYTFVLAHHPRHTAESKQGNRIPGLADFLRKQSLPKDRPFFYCQHRHFEVGDTGEVLKDYPNVIAMHGHQHRSCADELNLSQDAFTKINIPSLNYNSMRGGRENRYVNRRRSNPDLLIPMLSCAKTWQGLFASVYDNRIVVERRDFRNEAPLGPDWVIPLPSPDGSLRTEVRKARAVAPQFAPGARATFVERIAKNRAKQDVDQVLVTCPVAHASGDCQRAFDYEFVAVVGDKPLVRRAVYSPGAYFIDALDVKPVICAFAKAELPENWKTSVRFTVTPRDSFGNEGRSLTADG